MPEAHHKPGARGPADSSFSEIEQSVTRLEGVSLAEMGTAALLDRLDHKYLLPADAVADVLRRTEGYAALEVDGHRLGRYRTSYLDTPHLALYYAHHSGKLPRSKVRIRSYLDSGGRYLEVKRRIHGGRTEKVRFQIPDHDLDLADGLARASAAGLDARVPARELGEALSVDFTRLTLVALDAAERVTVDVGLSLSRQGALCRLPGIAVIEVKQEKPAPSRFRELLRALEFRVGGLSKYCLGIALLEPTAKHNRFKPVLGRLERVGGRPLLLDD